MTRRYAIIQLDNNQVVNVVEWDGTNNWKPPQGTLLVQDDQVDVGDSYDHTNNTFTKQS